MKFKTVLATLLSVGAAASGARAETLAAEGSDTLFKIVNDVLATGNCGDTTQLSYNGGGSGNGENAIKFEFATPLGSHVVGANTIQNNQVIAPMSRALKIAACSAGTTAEGLAFALDGLSVIRNTTGRVDCTAIGVAGDNVAFTDTSNSVVGIQPAGLTSPYAFTGVTVSGTAIGAWADALRVLYAGLHNNAAKDCGSDVRHALIRNWSAIYAGTCAAGETCTGGIKHAFRRGDLSGTTDTFAALLGLGTLSSTTFCNGTERQDKDPVRVNCDSTDDVCELCGTTTNVACSADPLQRGLGVVLAVRPPEDPTLASIRYNRTPCSAGLYALAPADNLSGALCPNGGEKIGTQCYMPTDAAGNFGCLASGNTFPVGTPTNVRGVGTARVYNRVLRTALGAVPSEGLNQLSSWYRLKSKATNANSCTEVDATRQIACLVSRDPCNVGFAGREAAEIATYTTEALQVNGLYPTVPNVRALISSPATAYPLSRKLYINSLRGFGNLDAGLRPGGHPEQAKLVACFQSRNVVDPIVTANGFVTLDDTTGGTVPTLSAASVCIAP